MRGLDAPAGSLDPLSLPLDSCLVERQGRGFGARADLCQDSPVAPAGLPGRGHWLL